VYLYALIHLRWFPLRYNLLNPERDTLQDGLEDGPDPSFTAAGGVRARPRPRPTEDVRASDFKPSDATTRTTNYSTSAGGVRPSQPSLSARSGQEGHYLSDVDLSPQLNMALRAELLYLVTLGECTKDLCLGFIFGLKNYGTVNDYLLILRTSNFLSH
jgi:hypothetical protein